MSEPNEKDDDERKHDEILLRMLKTPPQHHKPLGLRKKKAKPSGRASRPKRSA
jgi:hypothetical protein